MIVTPIEEIDMALAVRLESVLNSFGYYPDVESMLPIPIDNSVFLAELQQIRDNGKNPIHIFRPGSPRFKLEVNDGRVDIRRSYFDKGDIGYGHPICIEPLNVDEENPENNTFRKIEVSQTSLEIVYEFRYITNNENSHLIMDEAMAKAFGSRKYLKTYSTLREQREAGIEMFINGTPTDIRQDDYIERMYRYVVKDVFITEPDVIDGSVVTVTEINTDVEFLKEDEL